MKYRHIVCQLLLCLLMYPQQGAGQDSALDSLRGTYLIRAASAPSDTAKANAYLDLADSFRYENQDSVAYFIQQAKTLITPESHPRGMAVAAHLEAGIYFYKGEYQASINIAEKGVSYLSNIAHSEKLHANLLRIIGICYGSAGNYEASLKNFLEAQKLYEQSGDDDGLQAILNNIGVIRIKMESFDEALNIFLRLDEMADPNAPIQATIPVNLGFIYYELRDFEKAKQQLNRALALTGNVDRRAFGLSNFKLGQIYARERDFNEAINAFDASIDIYDEFQNDLEKVQSLTGLAEVYIELDDLSKAEKYAYQALEISESRNALPEQRTSLETLYKISKQSGEFEKALEYHEEFKAVSDSLQNSEINEEIGRLSAQYEFDKREQELILEQQKTELESAAQINRQKILLIGSVIVLFFAIIIIGFMYRSYSQKRKVNQTLAAKNEEIQNQTEKLRESNEIKDRLFSIIAHDLRGTLSSLNGIITLLEMNKASKEQLDQLIPEVARRFKYTSILLNNLLQWAQSQMDGYRIIPKNFDLTELLSGKKSLLQSKLDEKRLSMILPQEKYVVYADLNMIDLVVQNLISNAIKYCETGGQISISICKEKKDTLVQIQDTGVGIKPEKLKDLFAEKFYTTEGTNGEKGTGLGLMLCKDFIQKNGGKIWAESEWGEGSSFFFTLPKGDQQRSF